MSNLGNVVPALRPLDEDEFHSAVMIALSRLQRGWGKAKLAERLGVSVRQLGNIANGSLPAPHRLWNLIVHDPDALDAIDREYGTRRVPRDSICSTDPISAKMAQLLSRTIELEQPDSDGGAEDTLAEILALPEDVLRAVASKTAGWVERIDAHRNGGPRAVTGKAA